MPSLFSFSFNLFLGCQSFLFLTKFLSYHAQCNSGTYTCFFLSPFVYSHFTALFSPSLYLLFAAPFQHLGGWLRASSQKKFSLSPLCNNLCAILRFFKRSGPRCLLSALHNNDEGSRSGTRVSHINYQCSVYYHYMVHYCRFQNSGLLRALSELRSQFLHYHHQPLAAALAAVCCGGSQSSGQSICENYLECTSKIAKRSRAFAQ